MVALAGVALLETGLWLTLILLLVRDTTLRMILISGLAVLLAAFAALSLSPLRTAHHLTNGHLRLSYGVYLNARIPLTQIAGVRRAQGDEVVRKSAIRLERGSQRAVAVAGAEGQILIELTEPIHARVGLLRRGDVRTFLVNADDPEGVAGALTSSAPPPTHRETSHVISLATVSRPLIRTMEDGAEFAILIDEATRDYGSIRAVDSLSLAVAGGEVYGFLGPNGAGKTTTISMLVGLLRPSQGRLLVAGHDVWRDPVAAKSAFGFVADRSLLYERLTPLEFLGFLGQMRGLPRGEAGRQAAELIELLGLKERRDSLIGAFSFGMKRKVAMAGALLHRPRVLILDEPLNGLDPRSARTIKDLLLQQAAQGAAVFLSTHDLATAEALCHRVGIIHRGHLVAEGASRDLRGLVAAPNLEEAFLALTPEEVAASEGQEA